jgi:hypothetical protein
MRNLQGTQIPNVITVFGSEIPGKLFQPSSIDVEATSVWVRSSVDELVVDSGAIIERTAGSVKGNA